MIYVRLIVWIRHERQCHQSVNKDSRSVYKYGLIPAIYALCEKFLIVDALYATPVGDSKSGIPRKVSPDPAIGVEIKKWNFEIVYL